MRVLTTSLFLLAAACVGPSQSKLAATPTAHTKANTGEAPAASNSDEDRNHEVDAMSDMKAAQNARAEAADPAAPVGPTAKPPGKAKPSPTPASPDKAP